MSSDPPTPVSGRVPHRPGLDGLRGIAVAAVVVFHVWPDALPGGFLGVSVFFTLSGYLITNLLLAEHADRHGIALGSFWSRRVRRLLPAAVVVLAVVTVLGRHLPAPSDLGTQVLWALGNLYNWWLIATSADYGHLFSAPSPVEHFWSLAIEEQFYLVFPLVAAGLLRVGRRTFAVVMAAALAGSVLLTLSGALDPATTYFSTFTRAAEILAGVLLALVWPLGRAALRSATAPAAAGVAALAAILVLCRVVQYDDPIVSSGLLPATAALSCLAIVFAAGRRWSGALAVAPLVWLGRRSYGIYLIHWPVVVWLDAPGVVQVAVSLALAEVSYQLVEQPIRVRRILARPVPALTGAACAVTVVVALALGAFAPPRDTTRVALAQVPASATSDTTGPEPTTDLGTPPPDTNPSTSTSAPAPTSPATIWVLGDSQADGVLDAVTGRRDPAVDAMRDDADEPEAYQAERAGRPLVVVDLAVPGCDGGRGTAKVRFAGRVTGDERCARTLDDVATALDRWGPPDVVIWMVGASTVTTPRTFPGDGADDWHDPLDPVWQDWWRRSTAERLDWLAQVPATHPPVLWVTPAAPVWSEDAGRGTDRDQVEQVTEAVGSLMVEIAADRPAVRVADLRAMVEHGGPDGGPLTGTVDGIHWGTAASLEHIWPWLLDQALPMVPATPTG